MSHQVLKCAEGDSIDRSKIEMGGRSYPRGLTVDTYVSLNLGGKKQEQNINSLCFPSGLQSFTLGNLSMSAGKVLKIPCTDQTPDQLSENLLRVGHRR